jgi:hypothetical protein
LYSLEDILEEITQKRNRPGLALGGIYKPHDPEYKEENGGKPSDDGDPENDPSYNPYDVEAQGLADMVYGNLGLIVLVEDESDDPPYQGEVADYGYKLAI